MPLFFSSKAKMCIALDVEGKGDENVPNYGRNDAYNRRPFSDFGCRVSICDDGVTKEKYCGHEPGKIDCAMGWLMAQSPESSSTNADKHRDYTAPSTFAEAFGTGFSVSLHCRWDSAQSSKHGVHAVHRVMPSSCIQRSTNLKEPLTLTKPDISVVLSAVNDPSDIAFYYFGLSKLLALQEE
ncbi:MAG: hypothetical protein Q9183_005786 [Haloplaca sp. 2 TL-2023]